MDQIVKIKVRFEHKWDTRKINTNVNRNISSMITKVICLFL